MDENKNEDGRDVAAAEESLAEPGKDVTLDQMREELEGETPEIDPVTHPDNPGHPQLPPEPDIGGDPVESATTGVDDQLPAVTEDPPIVSD